MIAIDLTPQAIRIHRAGAARLSVLQAGVFASIMAIGLSCSWQHVVGSSSHAVAFATIQAEVAALEQQLAQHAHDALVAERDQEQSKVLTARREVVAILLGLISDTPYAGISLSKLNFTVEGALLEGCARDAQTLSEVLGQFSIQCPRLQMSVERMRAVVISGETLESFQVRLAFSLEQHGAGWCGMVQHGAAGVERRGA